MNGNERLTVANYDTGSETFSFTDKATGRFAIDGIQFLVDGTAAMTCYSGVATMPTLTHLMAPKKAGVPYVEFRRKQTSVAKVVASLSKTGVLYVDRVEEDDLPDTTDQMKFNGVSFSQMGLVAPEIVEEDL